MYTRLLKKPIDLNKSFFLFGPRGTGKTTWLKQNFKNSIFLDLLESDLYTSLLSRPARLENYIAPSYKDWIIIDEIQKIPRLLNEVHRLIENNSYKFILTGSSARSLKKKGVNLLAGRALTFHMYPLTVTELDSDFNLDLSLQWGHLPVIPSGKKPDDFIKKKQKKKPDFYSGASE